jgi:hypothetical protein
MFTIHFGFLYCFLTKDLNSRNITLRLVPSRINDLRLRDQVGYSALQQETSSGVT